MQLSAGKNKSHRRCLCGTMSDERETANLYIINIVHRVQNGLKSNKVMKNGKTTKYRIQTTIIKTLTSLKLFVKY